MNKSYLWEEVDEEKPNSSNKVRILREIGFLKLLRNHGSLSTVLAVRDFNIQRHELPKAVKNGS
ncbi:MAG: hypothetical protein ABFS12_04470 [Bacteroidota bacterium]